MKQLSCGAISKNGAIRTHRRLHKMHGLLCAKTLRVFHKNALHGMLQNSKRPGFPNGAVRFVLCFVHISKGFSQIKQSCLVCGEFCFL